MPSRSFRENIIPVGNHSTSQINGMMIPRVERLKHYVGTIDIPGVARGTVCLLENGKMLTCLHNIIDYSALSSGKAELIDFDKYAVSAYFVKDRKVYKYAINGAPFNGLNKLKAYGLRALCFDYAFLDVDGNPVHDLGGGFKMEDAENFMPAFATDPMRTLAISGPIATVTRNGVEFNRYVSLSNNSNTSSQHYQIDQLGDHPSAPGFSGMAIVSAENTSNALHAIHSYRDNQGQQSGTKTSEILASARDQILVDQNQTLDPNVHRILTSWFEVLRNARRRADGSVEAGAPIAFNDAVQILQRGGDIVGDNRGEVAVAAKTAWGGTLAHTAPHTPLGLPHLHHPKHTDSQFPGHAFYPSEAQRLADKKAKEAEESRRRQLKAAKEAKDKTANNKGGGNQR